MKSNGRQRILDHLSVVKRVIQHGEPELLEHFRAFRRKYLDFGADSSKDLS